MSSFDGKKELIKVVNYSSDTSLLFSKNRI